MAKPTNISPGDIIGAARLCLQEKGLSATTLKEVAARAGVTQGTVYYHFRTKDDLLMAVMQTTIDLHLNTLTGIWNSKGDLPSKINDTLDATQEVYGRDESFQRLFLNMGTLGLQNQRASDMLGQQLEKVGAVIESFCQRLLEENSPGVLNPKHISNIIIAAVTGLAIHSIFNREIDVGGSYEALKQMLQRLMQPGIEKNLGRKDNA